MCARLRLIGRYVGHWLYSLWVLWYAASGVLMLVVMGLAVVTLAMYGPFREEPQPEPLDSRTELRRRLAESEQRNEALAAENRALKINVEALMRHAIIPPRRLDDRGGPDLIPAQTVSTKPEGE